MTSNIQKRILRYALSQLDIFDTDVLDLENLDISWGQQNVFNFKDVPLQPKKLAGYMHFHPTFDLDKASVKHVRITIPALLYTRPIAIEIDGVEIRLITIPEESRSKGRNSSRRSSAQHTESTLPTAGDLAASFLQDQSEEEKRRLRAELKHDAHQSQYSSSRHNDEQDDMLYGTGMVPISIVPDVPAYLTGFLQGIVDRLQVKIRNITLELTVNLPVEDCISIIPPSHDPISLQIIVEDVEIQGVTSSENIPSDLHCPPRKEGKRLVSLKNLRGLLISDASIFAHLARSLAVVSSPSVAQSAASTTTGKARASTHELFASTTDDGATTRPNSSPSISPEFVTDALIHSTSDIHNSSHDFEDDVETSTANLLRSRHNSERESILEDSILFDGLNQKSLSNDEVNLGSSTYAEPYSYGQPSQSTSKAGSKLPVTNNTNSFAHSSIPLRKDHEERMQQTVLLPERPQNRYSYERVSHSQPSLPDRKVLSPEYVEFANVDRRDHQYSHDSTPVASPMGTPPVDDPLAQSAFFSHADAESMYMSALSKEDLEEHNSTIFDTKRMPGAWDESIYDEANPATPSTDIHNIPRQASHDNLIHAIHERATLDSRNTSVSYSQSTFDITSADKQGRGISSNMSMGTSDIVTNLAKQLFTLDKVSLYLPSALEASTDVPLGTNNSTISPETADESDPLAASHNLSLHEGFSGHYDKSHILSPQPNSFDKKEDVHDLDTLDLELGHLDICFDVSVGRLMMRVVQRLLQLMKKGEGHKTTMSNNRSRSSSRELSIHCHTEQISMKFLERMVGKVMNPTRSFDAPHEMPSPKDILLQASFRDLQISSKNINATRVTNIVLDKFNFGYADNDIICFDGTLKHHPSPRNVTGSDVHVKIIEKSGATDFTISTLPLHIIIDLQKLDETFSWFGGLSGVLNMGSSMASTVTTPISALVKNKARSVHFDTPKGTDEQSSEKQNKLTVRFGGAVFDLIGRDCSIGVQTSAVKVAYRTDVIGVTIDHITIAGPHLRDFHESPAIVVKLVGTKLEFQTPLANQSDMDRLLELITPSRNPYDKGDEIMLNTLLYQRKNGSVLRITLSALHIKLSKVDRLSYLPALSDELARLASVTKYLPEDDRPGLLLLVLVHDTLVDIDMEDEIGHFQLKMEKTEIAQISVPPLIAASIGAISLIRNNIEQLVSSPISVGADVGVSYHEPVIRARMIGKEMEPKIKLQVENLRLDYHVSTLIDILRSPTYLTAEQLVASMTASVATLTGHAMTIVPEAANHRIANPNPLKVDVVFRNSILGLNPLNMPSQILIVLTNADISATIPKDKKTDLVANLAKGSILVVNDCGRLTSSARPSLSRRHSYDGGSPQTTDLCARGYVPVAFISSAGIAAHVYPDLPNFADNTCVEVDIHSELIVIESCADSTQTLLASLNGLLPPSPPNTAQRYRTEVMPIQDLLSSLSGDAFTSGEGTGNFEDDFPDAAQDDNIEDSIMIESQYIKHKASGKRAEYMYEEEVLGKEEFLMFDQDDADSISSRPLDDSASELDFAEDHFGDQLNSTNCQWSSAKNNYIKTTAKSLKRSPLRIRVRDVNVMWNLFDGYDWQDTRDTITKAVHAVEMKAFERNQGRSDRERMLDLEAEDENAVIGDFLFNSIYIGIPANGNPRDLATAINHELNDTATETESIAPTTLSSTSRRPTSGVPGPSSKRLRLKRSKRNKISFELKGINVDFVAKPPNTGETQNTIDIRVRDLDIFDRVPTSTWKKFATYMHDAGERESGANQVHIEMLTVKPMLDLAASEIVMTVTVLPLRLHVDQDALDFITRFFEFKSDSAVVGTHPADPPFLQRVEINSIQVQLDFKPKRVDYKSLRSGRTTEFMNFIVLDKADMVMRHCILYGISGFDKLGKALNDIWMPDIKKNQLPGILAGLAPFRPVVDVLSGIKTLVTVPQQEIRRDGRIWKGIGKGVRAFGGGTGLELLKAGAKLTTGTGAVFQGIEAYISGPSSSNKQYEAKRSSGDFGEDSSDESEADLYSAYANQPLNVSQGMRSAVEQIKKDLRLANGALIAMPGAFMEKGTVGGALGAVRDYAPMIVLRPFAGLAKGTGQALMGAVNSLDPNNSRQAQDKYKSSS